MSTIRAVVGARVSVVKGDDKLSHLAQRDEGDDDARKEGWGVVGHFEDLDVSAGEFSPWDRPDLGGWLRQPDEWDALIFNKVDRAFRSNKDCADLADWAKRNKKILRFTADGLTLNYMVEPKNPAEQMQLSMAEMFVQLSAIFAQMELNRIKGRAMSTHEYLRGTNRWPAGVPPYGYMVVDRPGGGKMLEVDPVSSEIVRKIGQWILTGDTMIKIADRLNEQGILTPARYNRKRAVGDTRSKNPDKEVFWTQSQVGQVIRNEALLGYKMVGQGPHRRPATGDNGMPIMMAQPVVTDEEWNRIQMALSERSIKRERRSNASPLLGLVYCESCGNRMYRDLRKNKSGFVSDRYACCRNGARKACPGYAARTDVLQARIDELVHDVLSSRQVMKEEFKPGEDHTAQLSRVEKQIDRLLKAQMKGYWDEKEEEFDRIMTGLLGEKKVLAALPQRKDEWVPVPTGETYAEAYLRLDEEGRRRLLMEAGVKLYIGPDSFRYYDADPAKLDAIDLSTLIGV